MGNMPNKLVGRSVALVAAIIFAAGAYLLGRLGGDLLAFGFTFDWYVHPVLAAYEVGHVLKWVGIVALLFAALSAALVTISTDAATRAWVRRTRYAPPKMRDPTPLDLHAARLTLTVGAVASLLAVLGFYAILALPVFTTDAAGVRGVPIDLIRPDGFSLMLGTAAAFGTLLGTYFGGALTFEGVLGGTLVRKAKVNLIARASLIAVRNAKAVVALVIVTTLVAGYYAGTVTTNVDIADVLPRGDPNTAAAKNLTEKFKSGFTQQVTFQFRVLDVNNSTQMALFEEEHANKLPNRINDADPTPDNITDEIYIRAMAEAIEFILASEPFEGHIGAPDFYSLINWTVAGGDSAPASAFSMPDTSESGEMRFKVAEAGVRDVEAVYDALDAVTSPTWRQTAVLITVDPKSPVSTKEIGERALEVREAYVEAVRESPAMYQVFGPDNPPQFSVDLPIANAHASELTSHDFRLLIPIIALFIAVTLFLAFRSVSSVVTTFSMLVIAVVWTFGVMGYSRIPLNTLNLAVVPLIMGIGIDYGIHMMNEFQEFRAKGFSIEDAWVEAGGGSAFALLVGAMTTVAGLMVMVISPSLLVAQVGMLGAVAIVSCYLLAILFIPALLTILAGRQKVKKVAYDGSRIMPALAAGISRTVGTRLLVVFVVLLMAGAAYASQQNLQREAFGDPPRNWLESDPLRIEHEKALAGFYDTTTDDVKANVIIIEGDLTDPAVHRYINGITATLRDYSTTGSYIDARDPNSTTRAPSRVIGDTLKDLPFLVNTYLTVRGGVPGAGQFLANDRLQERFEDTPLNTPTGDLTENYPQTRQELKDTLEGMFSSPLAEFGYLFADAPDFEMTVIVFSARAATYPDAEQVWNEVQSAIAANEALRPEGVQTNFFGNTAINYLFVAKQVPWLAAMNIASVALVITIVAISTRKLRPTLVVGIISSLTSLLWFGLLPVMGIGLAISLTLPLIFIAAMGSDYGLHLALRCQKSKDTRGTMESVGKGVLFSFVTTIGAFMIFTQISDLAGRRSIIGTVLAIAVVFGVTLLVIPLIYPVKRMKKGNVVPPEPGRSVPVIETTVVQGDRIVRAPETRSHDV